MGRNFVFGRVSFIFLFFSTGMGRLIYHIEALSSVKKNIKKISKKLCQYREKNTMVKTFCSACTVTGYPRFNANQTCITKKANDHKTSLKQCKPFFDTEKTFLEIIIESRINISLYNYKRNKEIEIFSKYIFRV